MTKHPTYITMDDALRRARELHPSTTFNQLYNYLYKCGLKGRWPNRTKLGGRLFRPREYRRVEVLELLAAFTPPRPKLEKIYRATQRPGEGVDESEGPRPHDRRQIHAHQRRLQ